MFTAEQTIIKTEFSIRLLNGVYSKIFYSNSTRALLKWLYSQVKWYSPSKTFLEYFYARKEPVFSCWIPSHVGVMGIIPKEAKLTFPYCNSSRYHQTQLSSGCHWNKNIAVRNLKLARVIQFT